jgi:hypothetical protein
VPYAISTNRIVWQASRWHPHHLASIAKQALIAEAELTPKPGLVDRRGSGAHTDLSLDLMRHSAETIEPFFASMAVASSKRPLSRLLREELGAIGHADVVRERYGWLEREARPIQISRT